jgi:hypothetical protein
MSRRLVGGSDETDARQAACALARASAWPAPEEGGWA